MKDKIYLIETKGKPSVFDLFKIIPRLGILMIAEDLRKHGFNVSVLNENIRKLDLKKYDDGAIFGISSTTATAPRAYELADKLKQLYPDSKIVMGGTHVTFMEEEALQHCDIVVRREGIDTMREIVQHVIHGSGSLEDIWGISYMKNGALIRNRERPFVDNLDLTPIPAFDLIEGLGKRRGIFRRKTKLPVYPIMLRLGCPYNCNFCSVTRVFGRKSREKSVDRAIKELALKEKYLKDGLIEINSVGDLHVFYIDDHFCPPKSREQIKEYLKKILDNNLHVNTTFSAQVRVDFAKNDREILELMKEANFTRLYIGIESTHNPTLKKMHKGLTKESIVENINIINEYGIDVHGMFIAGSDGEPLSAIDEIPDFAHQLHLKTIQILMLTPLVGTEVYEQLDSESRIFNKNWEDYDGHSALFLPNPFELEEKVINAMHKFYSSTDHLLYRDTKDYIRSKALYYFARRAIKGWEKDFKKYVKKWQYKI